MERNTKIIIIILALIVIGGAIFLETQNYNEIEYTTLGNTSIGTVEVGISLILRLKRQSNSVTMTSRLSIIRLQ